MAKWGCESTTLPACPMTASRRRTRPAGPPTPSEIVGTDMPEVSAPTGQLSVVPRSWWKALTAKVHTIPLLGGVVRRIDMSSWKRRTLALELARPLDDPSYNLCVPDGQSVRVPVIWVIELFPPSYASSMQRSILKQGWREDNSWRGFDTAQKIRMARQIGTSNARDLVRLVAQDQPYHPLTGSVQARLPKSFLRVDVNLIELGNSLTAVCAAIELRPEAAESVDRAMRRPALPRAQRTGWGFSIFHRQDASRRYVADAHGELRAEARRWLSARIPGVFSKEASGRLPVLDLIVAAEESPRMDALKASGMWAALGVASDFLITESPALGGIRFNEYVHPVMRSTQDFDVFSLFVEAPLVKTASGLALIGENKAYASFAMGAKASVSVFFSRVAINSLLALKSSQSADARDAAHKLHRRRSVSSIKSLRESFLRGSLDNLSVARGIKRIASNHQEYHWQAAEFETRYNAEYDSTRAADKPENQLDKLAAWQRKEADDLLDQDSQTREVLGVVASLTAGIEGIRSQRWALFVALLSLVAAVVAVALSLAAQNQSAVGASVAGLTAQLHR